MLNKFESHQTFYTFFCNTTFYSFMFGPAMVTGVASARSAGVEILGLFR